MLNNQQSHLLSIPVKTTLLTNCGLLHAKTREFEKISLLNHITIESIRLKQFVFAINGKP